MNKESIYLDLKGRILQEELPPGEWLIERDLSNHYQVSRTPIREILKQLAIDGLLEFRPKKGYMVKRFSIEEIRDIFFAREAIEGIAARIACQQGDDRFFEKIAELKKELEPINIEENPARGAAVGRKMHDAIIEAAQNFLLSEFYQKVKSLATLTSNISKKSVEIEKCSKEAHLAIMDALLEKDKEKSEQLMRKHLHTTYQLLLDHFYSNLV